MNGLVGENNGEDDLRDELVGDCFEDRDGKFATEFIFVLVVLGEVPELLDLDV